MNYQLNSRLSSPFGLGLRHEHFNEIIEKKPEIDWFEILTENFMMPGGYAVNALEHIRQDYPIVFHGVSLSIGSTDPLDLNYLKALKETITRFDPSWVSDHLCWTGIQGHNTHDLLPLPYHQEALQHVVQRLQQVQEFLGHAILIENPSSYLLFKEAEMTESDFLRELCLLSGCYLLLDVNNVYVSSQNHGFDPLHYIHQLPKDKIKQIHLAGHTQKDNVIIDTHDASIADSVFELYHHTIQYTGIIPTMIERDDNIPELTELMKELKHVKSVAQDALSHRKAVA